MTSDATQANAEHPTSNAELRMENPVFSGKKHAFRSIKPFKIGNVAVIPRSCWPGTKRCLKKRL